MENISIKNISAREIFIIFFSNKEFLFLGKKFKDQKNEWLSNKYYERI